MSKTKVVFIMSQGHSGSTFLALVLGSHPEIFGLGELARFEHHLPKICGICENTCEYWRKRAYLPILHRYFSQGWNFRVFTREILRYQRSIYSYLADWFDYSIFVDSSKYTYWIRAQLRYRRTWKSMTPILIHLTRDGRAVINSFLRKNPELRIEKITNRWLRSTFKQLKVYNRFDGPKCRIAYEDIASRPEEMIRRLCQFLEIEYFPNMLSYWEHEHHQIGGNTGARSLISLENDENRGIKNLKPGDWHKEYYKTMGKTIKLDLRWKKELPARIPEILRSTRRRVEQKIHFRRNEAHGKQQFLIYIRPVMFGFNIFFVPTDIYYNNKYILNLNILGTNKSLCLI